MDTEEAGVREHRNDISRPAYRAPQSFWIPQGQYLTCRVCVLGLLFRSRRITFDFIDTWRRRRRVNVLLCHDWNVVQVRRRSKALAITGVSLHASKTLEERDTGDR